MYIGDKREGYQAISSLAAEEFIPALGSDNEEQLNEVRIAYLLSSQQ